MPKIISIGVANPKRCLTQQESWEHLQRLRRLAPLEKKYYQKFMLDSGINQRYLALPELEDIFCEDQDLIIKRYEAEAPQIAARSCLMALERAGLGKSAIGFISAATCTGYLCPGLSSHIIERVGLNTSVQALDIQGMGCGAALPALAAAANFLSGSPEQLSALVNCTEICSAAIFWDNDLGLILSNSIFGDGSATVVLTNRADLPGPEIIDYAAVVFPEKREDLRFTTDQGRLRNKLSAAVPAVAARGVEIVVNELLGKNGLRRDEIGLWASHSGGRKVLEVIQDKLGLADKALDFSRETLRDYGNMSSPSVLFTLEKIMSAARPRPGDHVMLLSFGAGFSCYGMLLRY